MSMVAITVPAGDLVPNRWQAISKRNAGYEGKNFFNIFLAIDDAKCIALGIQCK